MLMFVFACYFVLLFLIFLFVCFGSVLFVGFVCFFRSLFHSLIAWLVDGLVQRMCFKATKPVSMGLSKRLRGQQVSFAMRNKQESL